MIRIDWNYLIFETIELDDTRGDETLTHREHYSFFYFFYFSIGTLLFVIEPINVVSVSVSVLFGRIEAGVISNVHRLFNRSPI